MSQKTATTDGGETDGEDGIDLNEEMVTTTAALVDLLDEDYDEEIAQERAERIMEVLEETGATLLVLQSKWHGNEFLGDWYERVFAHVDFETDKAVHISEGVNSGYPMGKVGKLRRERDSHSPNDRALERYQTRAFKQWEMSQNTGPSWSNSGSQNLYVTDEYCPKGAIDMAISAPSRDDHYVFTHEGEGRGTLDEADLVIRKTTMHEYKSSGRHYRDEKFVVEGDSYEAFVSANLKNILPFMPVEDDDGEVVEQGTFHSYTGDAWVIGMDGLQTFIDYATDIGFSVGVHNDYEEGLPEGDE